MDTKTNLPAPEQLALLTRITREIVRARRLSTEDAEDFMQTVQLRLIERDYDVFRRFSGRSSLQTYLRVVVNRMLLDWRNSAYGKWRASAAAVRLGEWAVLLERLIYRDGYTLDQAVEVVSERPQAPPARDLRRLVEHLPPRPGRHRVPEQASESVAVEFEDPVEKDELRVTARALRSALREALNQLTSTDRQLIRMRYQERRSVQVIAQSFQLDAKKLYRRFDRVLRELRQAVAAAGPGSVS